MHPYAARLSRRSAALWVLYGLAAPARGAADVDDVFASGDVKVVVLPSVAADQTLDFDIPAASLGTALQRYAVVSSRPALFSSAMVAGRRSTAVRGRYTPEAALHLLLEGTGVAAQKGRSGPAEAFVLRPISSHADAARSSMDGLNTDYGGWVQARIWEAFCADARTVPGDYRVLLRFEVDASGRVHQSRLLTSTGSARRDAAVLDTLQRVRVDRSPPPDMAQPLTMVLLPRDPQHPDNAAQRCDNIGGVPRS
ncbi:TonB family protein [Cupriavidus basilensis]|uniref:TonB family protein n=1 Tax=Cupriavidus basilensis TaxID=68895 RepID=A0ABT6AY95_9BURK|nr:TonB family protein [Cupriavidus basilensis]MDF3837589.1 TonB family protein [Cupriavidus basilensis]